MYLENRRKNIKTSRTKAIVRVRQYMAENCEGVWKYTTG